MNVTPPAPSLPPSTPPSPKPMTTPTTTAAPAAPQPERKPTFVGRVVRDDGVTVERWERPVLMPRREVVYDLDAADDEPVPRRRRRVTFADDPPASGGWSAWAGRYAPTAGAGLAFTLILYLGGWWLGWFQISWAPTAWPQTQPSRSTTSQEYGAGSRSTVRTVGGANRCREFLLQLRERGGFGSLSADEEAAAKRAIDEDGR